MRARLTNLLSVLGEMPAEPPPGAGAGDPEAGQGLARLIDCVCPSGTIVVHGRRLPGDGAPLEHMVVSSRGLVVVSPRWGAVPGWRPRGRGVTPRADAGAYRSHAVRSALRRANGLREWLSATPWSTTPVLAAVCSAGTVGPATPPPVVLNGLWLGSLERFPSWLASGEELDGERRAELSYFLVSALPAA